MFSSKKNEHPGMQNTRANNESKQKYIVSNIVVHMYMHACIFIRTFAQWEILQVTVEIDELLNKNLFKTKWISGPMFGSYQLVTFSEITLK